MGSAAPRDPMTTLYLLPIRNMDLRTREILGEANRWVKGAGGGLEDLHVLRGEGDACLGV